MIPVSVEGVRRNFTIDSPLLYSISLLDETGRRLLVFGLERHEALPIVAVLNHWTLPRPGTLNLMAETLTLLDPGGAAQARQLLQWGSIVIK